MSATHETGRQHLPPLLQDQVVLVAAPTMAICPPHGQLDAVGAAGLFTADRRMLSRLVVRVGGHEPEPIHAELDDAATARFVGIVRDRTPDAPDTTLRVERVRTITESTDGQGMRERIRVVNSGRADEQVRLEIEVGTDLADVFLVRRGDHGSDPIACEDHDGTFTFTSPVLPGWALDVSATPTATESHVDGSTALVGYDLDLAAGMDAIVEVTVSTTVPAASVVVAKAARDLPRPKVSSSDGQLALLVDRSVDDLEKLLLADPREPADTFYAAGAPWYLTLFGRDSIITAGLALGLGWERAASTLRVLARRQATEHDVRAASEPGKILHEIRPEPPEGTTSSFLPPVYYGSIDSTPLWILLLAEARRWGMPDAQVRPLVPALRHACHWLLHESDPDDDGLLEYIDTSGRGLANQGWKDSGDSVQNRDGRLAKPPVALCEVQGYAYRAALDAADLLGSYGDDSGDAEVAAQLRVFADRLKTRFHEAFWLDDDKGRYLALALDGEKQPVTAVASNAGHLVATGLLDEAQIADVAARLTSPELASGFGLRTMADTSGGFNPIGYHTGSVWTHDTGYVIRELARAGQGEAAATLAAGLLAAAPSFRYRMPELYGGEQRAADQVSPMPYPASCRPQAWSAATSMALLTALLGLEPDVPNGRVTLRPVGADGGPADGLEVHGLRVGDGVLSVRVRAGEVDVWESPPGVTVSVL